MTFNADLISDLARQRVVLFLGAGVSASAQAIDGNNIKGWGDFLSSAAKNADTPVNEQSQKLIENKDFLLACEVLQQHYGDDWEDLLTREFGKAATPSRLHKSILNLDQRVLLTTNFDKLLETAWAEIPVGGTHYARVHSKIDDKIFRSLRDHEGRYLVKIHGSIDEPDGVVFSRSQYIKNAFGNTMYSSFLESLLLNYTFLFIGFSMDDPAITSLMELYTLKYPKARPHYMFTGNDHPESILDINKRLRKLVVMQYDPKDHHAKLPDIINELGDAAHEKRKEILANMMTEIKRKQT